MINESSNFSQLYQRVVLNIEMPLDVVIFGTVAYLIIFVFGMIGNILTIYVLTHKNFKTFANYLLANLSIADALTLMTCVPTALHDLYAKERWYLGKTACYMVLFTENCLGNASILTIFFISLERFYVICKPLVAKSLMTQSRTLKLMILIWITSIIINLPLIFMSEYNLRPFHDSTVYYKCTANTDDSFGHWRQIYSFFVTFIIYLIIGILLLFMYYRITKNLNRSTTILVSNADAYIIRKLSNDIIHEPDELEKNINYIRSSQGQLLFVKTDKSNNQPCIDTPRLSINSNLERYIKPRKQLIFILKLVIFVFYVCLFPLKIWNIIIMFFGHHASFRRVIQLREYWIINITLRILFFTNSFINPILFNCLSTKFRRGFRHVFSSKRLSRVEMEQANKFSIRYAIEKTEERKRRGSIQIIKEEKKVHFKN